MELFIKHFFKEFLKCIEYYFRVEYQHRDSPHVHGIVWMSNAPNVLKRPINCDAVKQYADQFLSTWNPFGDVSAISKGGFQFRSIRPQSHFPK